MQQNQFPNCGFSRIKYSKIKVLFIKSNVSQKFLTMNDPYKVKVKEEKVAWCQFSRDVEEQEGWDWSIKSESGIKRRLRKIYRKWKWELCSLESIC